MIFVEGRLQDLGQARNGPLNICFVDLQKAYDSIDCTLLWEVLAQYPVPPRMIEAIRMFRGSMRARVQLDYGELSL